VRLHVHKLHKRLRCAQCLTLEKATRLLHGTKGITRPWCLVAAGPSKALCNVCAVAHLRGAVGEDDLEGVRARAEVALARAAGHDKLAGSRPEAHTYAYTCLIGTMAMNTICCRYCGMYALRVFDETRRLSLELRHDDVGGAHEPVTTAR
jgi:hypothetical protein